MKRLIKDLTLGITQGHFNTSTYPSYVTWGAGLLYAMTALSICGGGFYVLYAVASHVKQIATAQEAVTSRETEAPPTRKPEEIDAQGGSEIYSFAGSWEPQDNNSIINVDGSLSLLSGKKSSIYQYTGIVPARNDYGLNFVSRGVFGPNVVVGRPQFYEITVGDRSDKVITLKATDKIDGNLLAVDETSWVKYRPDDSLRPRAVNCIFASGEELRIDVSEAFIESSGQFKVDVTVTCNDKKYDTFSWVFTPPPKWALNEKLYLAIIDDENDSNQTKIDFLNPIVLTEKSKPEQVQ